MPDKPEDTPNPRSPTAPPRRRRWLRALLKYVGLVLLLVAIFHRPLFYTVARLALIQIAAKQNVKLEVHFEGTIFTNLTVRNVQAFPTGKGPSPVEKITIESVRLQYSLPTLARRGVGEFLKFYEIKNADLVFKADPSKTKEEKDQKKSLAETLNNLLGQPALYADAVNIDNFNITVHAPASTTEVKGVHLFLHPWEPGFLRIARLAAPGIPVWEHLEAKTSYANRNLYISGLQLSPELIIDEFNFDASQRSQDKGSMDTRARLFGGALHLSLGGSKLKAKGENLDKSYDTTLHIEAGGIDLQAAGKYFGAPALPVARLGWLKTVFTGEPEKPRTWKGDVALRGEGFAFGQAKVDAGEAYLTFANGLAQVTSARAEAGASSVSLKATAQLPASINDFSQTEGDAELGIDAPDLAALTQPFMPVPIGGSLGGGGKVGLHQRRAAVDLNLSGRKIGNKDLGIESASLQLAATKSLEQPAGAPFFDGLVSHATVRLAELRYGTFSGDSLALETVTKDDLVTLHTAEMTRAENHVTAKGTYRLPRQSGAPAPIDGEFAIDAPTLETFHLGAREKVLSGHLAAQGKVQSVADVLSGAVRIEGGDFVFGDFKAARLSGKIDIANNEASVEQFALNVNQTDQIAATGKVGLKAPMSYEGALLVLFKDLAVLDPLLATFGVNEPLGGGFDLSVESQGKIQGQEHLGQMKLQVTKAHYGKFDLSEFRLAGLFGPDFAESSDFHVATGPTSLTGKLEWRDRKAKLKEIVLQQGTQQALTGYLIVPFDPRNPDGPLPLTERMAVNLNANQLDIGKLMQTLHQTAPVAGNVSLNLVLAGQLNQPIAHLKLAARNLKSPAAAKFDAAEVDLVAHYSEKELTLDGSARQKDIQPLVIKGRVPLNLEATLQKKTLDPELPIDLLVRLPPSSLAFIPKLVPSVRSISGNAAIDAHVTGTVGQPVLAGATNVKIEYARMKGDAIPPIGAFQLDLGFTQNAVTVRKLHGDLGGGTFDLSGKVLLPKLTEPVFDLRLKSDKVLAKRDDSVTVRVDTDLAVNGPLAAGKVAGTIYVTQSRFFREIDILPIAMPGRPKPKPEPKSVPTQATIALGPPFDKWTFDVAVKTRPNDLFQVRGNLATGAAAIDLKFAGTGAAPSLEGNVHIENLVATLPFSKLTITRGFVLFTKDAMLQPRLDLTAESTLREYLIHAYISGPATDPQVSLTSEPPLPQQDIISLLATGTTLSELTGSPDVLASRAAVLLFQQLYRKVFKQKEPSENAPMFNRLNVEVGSVDNRTGREEIGASFKLNESLYLLGNVDVTGDFQGRVRYLLRFR